MIALSSIADKQTSANSLQLSGCREHEFPETLESSPMSSIRSTRLISVLLADDSLDPASKAHSVCAAGVSYLGGNPHIASK